MEKVAGGSWARYARVGNVAFDLVVVAAVWGMMASATARAPVAALLAALTWGAGAAVVRFYDPFGDRSWLDELALACLIDGGVLAVLAATSALGLHWHVGSDAAPRGFLLVLALTSVPRRLYFRKLEAAHTLPDQDVLILGTGALGASTARTLMARIRPRSRVVGFLRLPGEKATHVVPGLPVLGEVDALERILREQGVSEVYVAADPVRQAAAIQRAITECERYGIPFALPACCFRLGRAQPAHPGPVSDGYLHYVEHPSRPYQRGLKRLFDIVASASALVLLSPLLLTVAALIKLTSRGPLFFKQERVGLYGRTFPMLKFRTMVPNAEALRDKLLALNEQKGPVFKMAHDPRITPIGRILRKHSIDELPQLLNVLRGDMSVVGPRPPLAKEVAQYAPWQRRRLSVRPGLTCIWQVSGRNEIGFDEWMYLDMRYIDHWSFRQDLGLVLKTIPVVLTGRGAS